MAGGKGTRLNPFTNVLPKPLIPINGKPVIKIIIDRLIKYKFDNFHISLNEKSKILKAYFYEQNFKAKINFILENKKLGTVGALSLIKKNLTDAFLVVNCDTLVKADYNELYHFHKKNKYDLTVVGCVKNQTIPYGVCQLNKSGEIISINEKPNHNFIANTGMYIMNKETTKLIPHNKSMDMDKLINKILNKDGRIGLFPIGHEAWNDIGTWPEYEKTTKKLISE